MRGEVRASTMRRGQTLKQGLDSAGLGGLLPE
jgi:hypothetical protein